MNDHILIIDDNEDLLNLTKATLKTEDYEISTAKSGRDGLQKFYEVNPDLVILDIMMPDMSGWTVCERIREMSNVPILMLTGLSSDHDIEQGVELGADNYLVKPVMGPELLARVKALLRRTTTDNPTVSPPTLISHAGLQIDIARHAVLYENRSIHLTPTEFKLLVCLAQHRGRILPHNFILEQVWGLGYEGNRDILRLYIQKLRAKLKKSTGLTELIQAHWGLGYRFD